MALNTPNFDRTTPGDGAAIGRTPLQENLATITGGPGSGASSGGRGPTTLFHHDTTGEVATNPNPMGGNDDDRLEDRPSGNSLRQTRAQDTPAAAGASGVGPGSPPSVAKAASESEPMASPEIRRIAIRAKV